MRKFAPLFPIFCGFASCAGAAPAFEGFEKLAFTETRSVGVSRVQGIRKDPGGFHGYKRVSEWLPLNPRAGARLGNLLQKQVAAQISLLGSGGDYSASACFEPGYAIRLDTNAGPRDFLVCLSCAQLYVYDGDGHYLGIHMDDEFLVRMKANYMDEFVLKEGIESRP